LAAWNKAQDALKRLETKPAPKQSFFKTLFKGKPQAIPGESFETIAAEVSEDESAKQNNGHIGWVTSFRTIYPFETVAYNTLVGNISQPVRTMFGYHIIKVHDRRASRGEVLTAHIMKFTSDDEEANKRAKEQIDSLYARVLAGDDFGTLAKEHSDDKGSAANNGEIPWFGTGRMVPEYEQASFALENAGDVSAPVQSAYGWHIIKLLDKKGLASYDELKAELERRVKRDERSSAGKKAFVAGLYRQYNVRENSENLNDFYTLLDGRTLTDSAFNAEAAKLNKTVLNFAGETFAQSDFAAYLKKHSYSEKTNPADIIDEKFKTFIDEKLLAYEDTQLEKKHDDFRFLMQEYHDGILLFEVSNQEVWDRASKDSEGLDGFFTKNKSNYKWEKPHYKGRVILCKDQATLKAAKAIAKLAKADSLDKYLPARLNDSIQYIKIEKGLFVQGDNNVVDREIFKVKGIELSEEYPYAFVVGKNLNLTPESYTDVRGLVTADYQDYLEKEWIRKLRGKYPVVVDQHVLKTVKKN
ncbi:MAG: peptidylprolyl isomerase, partial [Prevotellaceae bacterium]|jgi:peptidyl-prolyl cis-trans isomerase SurA|nr:peptidylprolyl isomerase [Prevotellaceae bacterium]